MSVLSTVARHLDSLGDRVNPIVIKETRQAVRSRAVVSVLSLFILVLLGGAAAVLVFSDPQSRSTTQGAGWETFLTFNGILLVVCGLFVPIYVAIRAAGDRSGVAADLLFTTTIRPASVIWGKLAAGMLVALLLFATAIPFVTVSYLLRGIDLPTIAFWLAFDALFILLAAQVAVFTAVLPTGVAIRVLIGLGAVIVAFYMVGGIFVGITFLGETSVTQFDTEAWMVVLSTASFVLLGMGLLFALSVSCVSPNPGNRALLPRAYVTLAVVLSYPLMLVIADQVNDLDVIEGWFSVWLVIILIAALISSGERRDPGARILHSRMFRRRGLRTLALTFSSGCYAGLLWCTILTSVLVLGLACFGVIAEWLGVFGYSRYFSGLATEGSVAAVQAIILTVAYCLFAIALRDGPLRRFSKGPAMTPAIAMLLIAAVSILPPMFVAFTDRNQTADGEAVSLLNPVSPLIWRGGDHEETRFVVAGILLLVSLLAASGGIARSARAYRNGIASAASPVTDSPVAEQLVPQTVTQAQTGSDA